MHATMRLRFFQSSFQITKKKKRFSEHPRDCKISFPELANLSTYTINIYIYVS